MGKQGPCCHCGTSTTPLWRNGPPDKPILCNACGSRWRTKGTLANYMPMHTGGCGANASLEYRWPRGKKVSQKVKEQKSYKRKEPSEIFREFEFSMVYSQQYGKTLEEDVSTKSSSISGLSSEGCFQPATPLEMHSTVQSSVWDSPVPSKKRTCMSRQRPTCLEKLTKTVKVSQGCESSYLSGSSEEELLYECKDSIDISEIGLGGYFIGQTNKFTREEESEASSLPINKKGPHIFDNCQDYPKVLGTDRHAHYDATIDSEQWKPLKELVGFSQSCHSLLISVELEDVVNFDTFTSLFNEDEQRWLKKYISLADNFQNAESLKRMFNSFQFKCAMSNFQHLLSEDVFGVSNSINHQSENLFQELLLVTDLVNSKWIERYSQMRNERKARENLKVSKITGSKRVRKGKGYFGSPVTKCSQGWIYKEKENSNGQPPLGSAGRSENFDRKRTLWKTRNAESEFHESIDTGSTSKEAIGIETTHKSMFLLDSNNLFVSPNERTPTLLFESIADFTDEDSDSVLLFDVPANLSFPQAELLHLPIQKCKTSNSFNSDVQSSENVNTPSVVNSHSKSEEFSDLSALLWNPENMETNQIVAGKAVLNPDGT